MLVPLHHWQLDKNGRPKLNANGERVPHKKRGQRKTLDEMSPEERDYVERSEARLKHVAQRQALDVLGPIGEAKETLGL